MDVIPGNEIANARSHTFTIKGVGDFTLHRPLMADYKAIGRRVTALSGGMNLVDQDAMMLIRIEAILETLADDKPKGFKFDNLEDPIPLFVFLREYGEWLDSFRPDETE